MKNETVYDKISKIAIRTPNKIAVQHKDKSITYDILEKYSNQLANLLSEKVENSDNIAIFLEDGIELIQSAIGIMKAGFVFVSADINYPENRIKTMIQKVDASWIVTASHHLDYLQKLFGSGLQEFHIILMDENIPALIDENLKRYYLKDYSDEAKVWKRSIHSHIIFTSGSTGTPKAILGRHKSLKHFIDWEIKEFQIDENCVGSQLSSSSFDPFLRDVFVPLCAGGTVCIPDNRDILLSSQALKQWITINNITLIHIIPTLFRVLIDEGYDESSFPSLQYVLLAGELVRGRDVKEFLNIFKTRIQLINLYGPAESTMAKAFYRIQPGDGDRLAIPIGKPIDSTQLLILNSDMQLSPIGNIGEIYIRTPYLSAGYYKDKALNAKVFIKNPFSTNEQDILYKTGDKGKLLPNGDYDIMGRVDNQMKVHAVRIEPEEIENKITSYPHIKQAVVTVKDSVNDDAILCAYLIAEKEVSIRELKLYLKKELLDTMIPSYFIFLEKIPTLPNGKIDRKSLPDPKILLNLEIDYEAPQDEIEEKLKMIWEDVLQIKGIGRKHNVFEIGANSINSLKIISFIQKEFDAELSLGDLVLNPTLSELAQNIRNETELSKMECIVRLNQVTEDKLNLFILHTINGHVFGYKELAKLLENDFNIYGLQGKGLTKECPLPNSIEEIVAYYLYEIKKIQPEGPYLIGGHCTGILFAYDLVRLIEDNGDEVERLIAFDQQMWWGDKAVFYITIRSFISRPFKAIRRTWLRLIRKNQSDWIYPYYLRHARKGERVSSKETSLEEHFKHLERDKYRFRSKINAPIFATKSKDSVWVKFTEEHWRKMTRGEVSILETRGDHWNLFDQPYVNEVAKAVRQGVLNKL